MEDMTKKIAIYGAGGFGREVAWLAESCDGPYEVVCFVDDDPAITGKEINGIPVLSPEGLKQKYPGISVVAAIGAPSVRQAVMEKMAANGFHSADLIYPRTEKSRWVDMDEGMVIWAGCILTTNIQIGRKIRAAGYQVYRITRKTTVSASK